jgi:hypothetical protein
VSIRFLVYLLGFICLLIYFGVYEEAPGVTVSEGLATYLGFYGVLLSFWLIFCESLYQLKEWGRRRSERASADKRQKKAKAGLAARLHVCGFPTL